MTNRKRNTLTAALSLTLLLTATGCSTSTSDSSASALQSHNQTQAPTTTACQPTDARKAYSPAIKRLASDVNTHWGVQAIHADNLSINTWQQDPVVAVIDSGVESDHPNILPGHSLLPEPSDLHDETGHGTAIASLILRVAPKARILPIKTMTADGEQAPDTITAAINYALDRGASVISLSLAMPNDDATMQQALDRAARQNVPIIAATGNNGRNELAFPANQPNVISVISRDINNVDAAFSNVSTCKKSFSAPGVHLQAADTSDEYISGTSYAVAYVTGTVSLLKGIKPALTPSDIQTLLAQSTVDGNDFSYGLIQADQAIAGLHATP